MLEIVIYSCCWWTTLILTIVAEKLSMHMQSHTSIQWGVRRTWDLKKELSFRPVDKIRKQLYILLLIWNHLDMHQLTHNQNIFLTSQSATLIKRWCSLQTLKKKNFSNKMQLNFYCCIICLMFIYAKKNHESSFLNSQSYGSPDQRSRLKWFNKFRGTDKH